MKIIRRPLVGWMLMDILIAALAARTRSQSQDRVRLADVQVLTLQASKYTTGRRSAPVPQLSCQGGCGQWTPDMVQCYNMGSDGTDAAWKCEANMADGYSFSSVEVGCEGYDFPEDPYILKGSCQLIYSLKPPLRGGKSGDGRSSYSSERWEDDGGYSNPTWDGRPLSRRSGTERGFDSRLLTWAVLGLVGYVLYHAFTRAAQAPDGGGGPPTPTGGGGWGGGWGGGGGGAGGGGGGGDNWRGGGIDNSGGPSSKGTSAGMARPPAAPAAQGGGATPWLVGGGLGAALGYMLRPRQRGYMPARGGGMAWNQTYGVGGGGRGGAYGGRGEGGGGGTQVGFGGTSRR